VVGSPEHILVPKHEVLSGEDSEKILKASGLTAEQLPKISISDAALKGMEVEEGNVVRITRMSDVDKKAELVYYRIVID